MVTYIIQFMTQNYERDTKKAQIWTEVVTSFILLNNSTLLYKAKEIFFEMTGFLRHIYNVTNTVVSCKYDFITW